MYGARVRIWPSFQMYNEMDNMRPHVQCIFEGRPVASYNPQTWSFGAHTQSVFRQPEIFQLMSLLVVVGWPFETKGDHFCDCVLPAAGTDLLRIQPVVESTGRL